MALRYGKASDKLCAVEMAEAKKGGAGIISFWAKKWSANEADCNIAVEVSTDNGANWREVGNTDIKDANWKEYTFTANIAGDVRIRLRRTSGARMHLDDVAVSNYSTGVSDPAAERHQWDAFSNQGVLTVTVSNLTASARVYIPLPV